MASSVLTLALVCATVVAASPLQPPSPQQRFRLSVPAAGTRLEYAVTAVIHPTTATATPSTLRMSVGMTYHRPAWGCDGGGGGRRCLASEEDGRMSAEHMMVEMHVEGKARYFFLVRIKV